jgi:putative transposase
MHRYNWVQPHQLNGGLAPGPAEEKLNVVFGISWPLQFNLGAHHRLK